MQLVYNLNTAPLLLTALTSQWFAFLNLLCLIIPLSVASTVLYVPISVLRNHNVLQENAQHVSRFIALASVNNPAKKKVCVC